MSQPRSRAANLANIPIHSHFFGSRNSRFHFNLLFVLAMIGFAYLLTACTNPADKFSPPAGPITATQKPVSEIRPTITQDQEIKFSEFNTPTPKSNLRNQTPIVEITGITPTPTRTVLPEMTSDLLFLSGEDLVRWDPIKNIVVPLAANVIDYAYSADGRRIAMLRYSRITANGIALLNLDILDMHSKQITSISKGIASLSHISISPDGRWIAYQLEDDPKTILGVSIQEPETLIELGSCTQPDNSPCKPLAWAPDGFSLLWEDSQGLWLSKPERPQPVLVAPRLMEVLDPKGQQAQIRVSFKGFNWSPEGRFGITQISTQAGVCWYAVLDTRAGNWLEIPETFENVGPASAAVGWLRDGKIVTINPRIAAAQPGIRIDVYNLIPTGKQPFELEREFFFSTKQLPLQTSDDKIKVIARWPDQTWDQILSFGITTTAGNELVLFWVDLENEQSEISSLIEKKVNQVFWAPDGQGALVLDEPTSASFLKKNEAEFLNLFSLTNHEVGNFQWSPPAPRS